MAGRPSTTSTGGEAGWFHTSQLAILPQTFRSKIYIESSAAVSPKRGRKSNNFLLRAVAFVHTKKLQTAILTPLDVKNNGNVLTVIGGSKLILSFVYLLPPKINAVNR